MADERADDPRDAATETDNLGDLSAVGSDPGSLYYLLVREGGSTRVIEVRDGEERIIGRSLEASVAIDDPKASRLHARVKLEHGRMVLSDLGSRNGTRLNNTTLMGIERPIFGGDVIRIGASEIIVVIATGSPEIDRSESSSRPDVEHVADVLDGIIVADPAMARVFQVAKRLARVQTNVLILGETGVGKEVLAQQIHAWSPRARKPCVRLNCASLPDTLLESELFGHEKGAFTGADKRKTGWFEAADGGTLFLDETGELSPAMQAKLLSALENRAIIRLGGTQEIPVDVRIICATHRDLDAEVKAGRFREDLFYRISTFTMQVPPLRERPAEIAILAELFARELSVQMGLPIPSIGKEAARLLESHRWPGNVRELRNAIEHAVVLADGVILPEHLPPSVSAKKSPAAPLPRGAMRAQLAELERKRIEEALALEDGNQTRAAQRLGMSRRTLVSKLARYRERP
jgi:two-component system, NtrC family, response regulator AtoC